MVFERLSPKSVANMDSLHENGLDDWHVRCRLSTLVLGSPPRLVCRLFPSVVSSVDGQREVFAWSWVDSSLSWWR